MEERPRIAQQPNTVYVSASLSICLSTLVHLELGRPLMQWGASHVFIIMMFFFTFVQPIFNQQGQSTNNKLLFAMMRHGVTCG